MFSEAANIPRPLDALPQGADEGVDGGHEENRIRLSTTVWLTIASILIVAIVQIGLWAGLKWAEATRKADTRTALFPGRDAIKPEQFPEPRLEVRYDEEIDKVRAEESALVNHYGWADREKGVARIPVDRAIEILAQKGLPKVAAPEPTAGAPPNTFVPIAGRRDMAPPATGSTGESPAKAGAPPSVLPPGETRAGETPKPGEPAKPADESKKAGETRTKSEPTPPSPSTPSEAPKKKEARS